MIILGCLRSWLCSSTHSVHKLTFPSLPRERANAAYVVVQKLESHPNVAPFSEQFLTGASGIHRGWLFKMLLKEIKLGLWTISRESKNVTERISAIASKTRLFWQILAASATLGLVAWNWGGDKFSSVITTSCSSGSIQMDLGSERGALLLKTTGQSFSYAKPESSIGWATLSVNRATASSIASRAS